MVLRGHAAIEHGSTRTGRWLRDKRLRLAIWVAVAEGILVAFHVIPWSVAFFVAAVLILFYLFVGRKLASDSARQASWIGAASQALVVLVPALVLVVTWMAIAAVVVLAVIGLAVLFADRR